MNVRNYNRRNRIINGIINDILGYIIVCYFELVKNERFDKNTHEDVFRNTLIKKYLNKLKSSGRNMEDIIFVGGADEIDDTFQTVGKPDIKAYHKYFKCQNDEDYYMNFECKRLDGNATLNGKYISEGLKRYFVKKYTHLENYCGMLGFVINGNVTEIVKNINELLINEYNKNTSSNLQYNLINNKFEYSFNSKHKNSENTEFVVHHLMLDFCAIMNEIN